MIRGVGILRTMRGKDAEAADAISKIAEDHVAEAVAKQSGCGAPVRATMVTCNTRVVVVKEWKTSDDYAEYVECRMSIELDKRVAELVSESPTCEFFPEALHICKGGEIYPTNGADVGVLVRQKTSSPENGAKLRDVQRAAYERQMQCEPGCTCCIILAGSSEDTSQVRIIELWRTMQDISFHESLEWHAQGEEKVVPLVIDMDCNSVVGSRILF